MTVQLVRPGTAEQLARVAHFAAVEEMQPEELDRIAVWLLGDVPDARRLWASIGEDCEHLWSFITDDWDEDDLDPMSEQETELPAAHGWDACAERTRERLVAEIERAVWLARVRADEARRVTA